MSTPKNTDLLQQAFDFTPEDLAENIEGRLSEPQIAKMRLKIQSHEQIVTFLIGGVGIMIALCLSLSLAIYGISLLRGRAEGGWLLVIIGCGFVLALIFSLLKTWEGLKQDAADLVVELASGGIIQEMRGGNKTQVEYLIEVQGQKFKVTSRQFLALKNGEPYGIYYTPYRRQIMSVRPLEVVSETPFEES